MKTHLFPLGIYCRIFVLSLFFSCGFSTGKKSGNTSEDHLLIHFDRGEWVLEWNEENAGRDNHIWFSSVSADSLQPAGVASAGTNRYVMKGDFQPGRTYYFSVCEAGREPGTSVKSVYLSWEDSGLNKVYVRKEEQGAVLYRNGDPFFIRGIGGSFRLDRAKAYGANAFRSWHGNLPEQAQKDLDMAQANGMFLMNGYWLSQQGVDYMNEEYKERTRREVGLLAETFADHPNLLIWCLGNEIEIGANTPEAWRFVDELARIIKEKDKNHPVAVVISYNKEAAVNVVRYAPSVDILGINAYAAIPVVDRLVKESGFTGPYMITEWGPNGTWEVGKTVWGAPIEQTSEEKRKVYEERYANMQKENCIGSFVFLWGQKQETTPSWFGMFAETGVPGLPLNGEGYPTVEAMKKMWSGTYPEHRAPVITGIRLDGKQSSESVAVPCFKEISATVNIEGKPSRQVRYVWEILKEATEKGIGGSYEPRPERVGEVVTGADNRFSFSVGRPGYYRLFVYALDGNGMAGTANIPFRVFGNTAEKRGISPADTAGGIFLSGASVN